MSIQYHNNSSYIPSNFKSIYATSTYLQIKYLDILNVFLMVDMCIANISNIQFDNVDGTSKDFVSKTKQFPY